MNTLPLAVTCGEPAGIGPEIIAKAWDALRGDVPFFVIGDQTHLGKSVPVSRVQSPAEAIAVCREALPVLHHPFAHPAIAGQAEPENAQGVVDVLERAVELALTGDVAGICTAPINKKVLQDGAGFAFPGHTEFLADRAGSVDVVMMLASEFLRVVPTTIHIALQDVPTVLTPDLLRKTIRITQEGLRAGFGIKTPRVAVAGLNPHAGEGGAMGREEIDWIADLLQDMSTSDAPISGPHSADTLFHAAARKTYDAAVCMYHDQALIPIKTLDFDRGVNVTLGLPFIRTSPDHGTAFDIAGQGIANPSSMIAALRMAWNMAQSR